MEFCTLVASRGQRWHQRVRLTSTKHEVGQVISGNCFVADKTQKHNMKLVSYTYTYL